MAIPTVHSELVNKEKKIKYLNIFYLTVVMNSHVQTCCEISCPAVLLPEDEPNQYNAVHLGHLFFLAQKSYGKITAGFEVNCK